MPLFRRSRSRLDSFELSADPALTDRDLAAARDAARRGDWLPARNLLARSARDWDRREHLIPVLAESAVQEVAWIDTWVAAEPDNPDALMVRGHVEIIRGWLARNQDWTTGSSDKEYWSFVRTVQDAENLCRRAAELAPYDPMPWISLLMLARTKGEALDEFSNRWQQLLARDPRSREGHHQALQYLSAKWRGSHEQMFEFAYNAAEGAGPGSPLVLLPVYAHAEFYAQVTQGDVHARREHAEHWRRPQIRTDVDRALSQWLGDRPPPPHARAAVDHNYLAHALVTGGRSADAAGQFEAIGPYATELPWRYTHDDPADAFLEARREALRTTR